MSERKFVIDFEEGANPIIGEAQAGDKTAVSWREAKKWLRKYYLDKAKIVRAMRKPTKRVKENVDEVPF